MLINIFATTANEHTCFRNVRLNIEGVIDVCLQCWGKAGDHTGLIFGTVLAVNTAFCNCTQWPWRALNAAYAPRASHFYPPSTPCMFFLCPEHPKFKSGQQFTGKMAYIIRAFFCCLIKWKQRWNFLLDCFSHSRATDANREGGNSYSHLFSMKQNNNKWNQVWSVWNAVFCALKLEWHTVKVDSSWLCGCLATI